MKYDYIENIEDREVGFKIFNELSEIYGSRHLIFILASFFAFIFLLGVIFDVKIIVNSYVGFIISLFGVWNFGIQYYMIKKHFMKKEPLQYNIDLETQEIKVNDSSYPFYGYWSSDEYILMAYVRNYFYLNYFSISKNKVDKYFLDKVVTKTEKEKPLTWKDHVVTVVIVVIVAELFEYFS